MSWLSRITGVNIDLKGGSKPATATPAATSQAPSTPAPETPVQLPVKTAAGHIITALEPALVEKAEGAINGLLVKAGLGNNETEIDALIHAELTKIGL